MADTSSPSPYRVLLVDDDPAIPRLLSIWLERAGYCVAQARNGREALAAIEQQCPDFLITDWEMPVMDGLELCQAVRELRLPHYLYVLFLSVKASSDEKVAGLDVGADDFLTKPVHRDELLAQMRSGARVLELERRLSELARTDSLTELRRGGPSTRAWSRNGTAPSGSVCPCRA